MPRGIKTAWAQVWEAGTTTITTGSAVTVDLDNITDSDAAHWTLASGELTLDRDPDTAGNSYEFELCAGVSARQTVADASVVDESLIMWVEHHDGVSWSEIDGSRRLVVFPIVSSISIGSFNPSIFNNIGIPSGAGQSRFRLSMAPGDKLRIRCQVWDIVNNVAGGGSHEFVTLEAASSLYAKELGHSWLEELHDVDASAWTPAGGDLLTYDDTTGSGDFIPQTPAFVDLDREQASNLVIAAMSIAAATQRLKTVGPDSFDRIVTLIQYLRNDASFPDLATHGDVHTAAREIINDAADTQYQSESDDYAAEDIELASNLIAGPGGVQTDSQGGAEPGSPDEADSPSTEP